MEENVSKLLQMSGGILIGVLLLALISYFFSSIGLWPTEEDESLTAEQLEIFNKEYEVYDKKGMYGVDVISCLNKAISNNEKYVEGNAFLSGNPYGSQYLIDVWVSLSSGELEESIEVFRYDNGVERQVLGSNTIFVDSRELTMEDVGFDIKDGEYYTGFNKNTKIGNISNKDVTGMQVLKPDGTSLIAQDYAGNDIKGYYSLLENDMDNSLVKLMKLSKATQQGSLDRRVVNRTGQNLDIWSSVTWKTCLSDFKKRRYKCDFVGYNDKTGRVKEIHFSEI